jgi:hypothetical protein
MMKAEKIKIDEKDVEIFYFDVPMFHEDWHEAEAKGLSYIQYSHQGPDYWDDSMIFAKTEDKESVEKYFKECSW